MRKTLVTLLSVFILATSSGSSKMEERSSASMSKTELLYKDCGLQNLLGLDAFEKLLAGFEKYHPAKSVVAICDFSKPSTENRFFVIDLKQRKLVYQTLVAHGKNSGNDMATSFSNQPESLKSSKGFFLTGEVIQSPKHGAAILLEGLEKGINDNARKREIIIHGASYATENFIKQYGHLGRSFGCPALPDGMMAKVAPYIADGALLYIYAK